MLSKLNKVFNKLKYRNDPESLPLNSSETESHSSTYGSISTYFNNIKRKISSSNNHQVMNNKTHNNNNNNHTVFSITTTIHNYLDFIRVKQSSYCQFQLLIKKILKCCC
jgi:hypothetical protein